MKTTIVGGVYRDNGKENGNYDYSILGYFRIMEKNMGTTIWAHEGLRIFGLQGLRCEGTGSMLCRPRASKCKVNPQPFTHLNPEL